MLFTPLEQSTVLQSSAHDFSWTAGSSTALRIESRASQYCREQLGIDALELSPFRASRVTTPNDVTNSIQTVRGLLRQVHNNNRILHSGSRQKLAPLHELSVTVAGPSRSAMTTSPNETLSGEASATVRADTEDATHRTSRSRESTTLRASSLGGSGSVGKNRGGGISPLPSARGASLLATSRAASAAASLPPRSKPAAAAAVTVPASFHMSRNDLRKLFEDMCLKIETKATDDAEEKAAQGNQTNFEQLIASVIRVGRPVYTFARKYGKDKLPCNAYRLHLRALWKYSIGRILADLQRTRVTQLRDAKRRLLELVKLKQVQEAKERKKRRGELAVDFFNEVMPKKSSKVPPLTEELYRSWRNRFREICGNDNLQLTIRDLSGRVDALILRKLDRDHSGVIDLFELLKMIYPAMLARDLQGLMRKWDSAEAEASVHVPTSSLLSEESKRQIDLLFRMCDSTSKGVVTKQDMMAVFTPKDWEFLEPLWFEKYFPQPSSMVSFEEFMEMVKFIYPPFRSGSVVAKTDSSSGSWTKGLPQELLEAQERARLID